MATHFTHADDVAFAKACLALTPAQAASLLVFLALRAAPDRAATLAALVKMAGS